MALTLDNLIGLLLVWLAPLMQHLPEQLAPVGRREKKEKLGKIPALKGIEVGADSGKIGKMGGGKRERN